MKLYLQKLSERISLTEEEMEGAVNSILLNEVSENEVAAFLIALKTKGETAEEITGIVKAIRRNSIQFNRKFANVIDNCGTGGDGSSSFNISTTSAFVIAGAGIPVAKHGNGSVSSKTGSADVLRHLGVEFESETSLIEHNLEANGIAFLFAPHVHPMLKNVMKVRRELKIPTIFNLIGPLTNPIDLDFQVLGIYRRDLFEMYSHVLDSLGRKRAIIVNGAGYLDEASLQGENHLILLEKDKKTKLIISPEEFNLRSVGNEKIKGGDAKENAEILKRVLNGEKGAYRDTVLLNAALGIYAAGRASSISDGVKLATYSIDSGAAMEKLHLLINGTRKMKKGVI